MFRHVRIHCMLKKVPAPFQKSNRPSDKSAAVDLHQTYKDLRKQKNSLDSLCGCAFIKVHLLQISINCHRTACGRLQVSALKYHHVRHF